MTSDVSTRSFGLAVHAPLTRRRFVEGLAAAGVLAAAGPLLLPQPAFARTRYAEPLTGSEVDLTIERHPVNFTGRIRDAVLVNGSLPAPLLRWREGDTVTIRVHNRLDEATSIHWHGILLPANMDRSEERRVGEGCRR